MPFTALDSAAPAGNSSIVGELAISSRRSSSGSKRSRRRDLRARAADPLPEPKVPKYERSRRFLSPRDRPEMDLATLFAFSPHESKRMLSAAVDRIRVLAIN
jgi:hypothetical protein